MLVNPNPIGFAFGEVLTSTQMNLVCSQLVQAIDGIGGGDYVLGAPLHLSGALVTIDGIAYKASVTVHTSSATGVALPSNVQLVDSTVVGGGGGGSGGAGPGNNNGGCGGGSGRIYRTRLPRATVGTLSNQVGDTYDVTVGAAGAGGAGGVTGATTANPGLPGGFSSITFNGPGALNNPSPTFVQAAGGSGGGLTAGGAGYSGGGGAGTDAAGAGHGGALGGGGQDGGGGSGRNGGAGETGVSYLGVPTGAGCVGGAAGAPQGTGLQAAGGGGGGPLGSDNRAIDSNGDNGADGVGASFTKGGKGGTGCGAGGGGGGQGATSSGAGGNGARGAVFVMCLRAPPP